MLPSERAKAYKMRLEAVRRRAGRPRKEAADNDPLSENAPNVSAHFRSDDEVGTVDGVSGDTVRNIISLNSLVPELLRMVDEKKISLTPAYQIAALTEPEQRLLLETMDREQATPSVSWNWPTRWRSWSPRSCPTSCPATSCEQNVKPRA